LDSRSTAAASAAVQPFDSQATVDCAPLSDTQLATDIDDLFSFFYSSTLEMACAD
jgi:hypothetical protein